MDLGKYPFMNSGDNYGICIVFTATPFLLFSVVDTMLPSTSLSLQYNERGDFSSYCPRCSTAMLALITEQPFILQILVKPILLEAQP